MKQKANTTLTKTKTKTKLAIATAVLIGSGGIALAAIPYISAPTSGTNKVAVYSCVSATNGIRIVPAPRQRPVLLTNGCRETGNAGEGMREYALRCVPPAVRGGVSTQYQVTWKPCSGGNVYGYNGGYGYNKR